MAIVIDAPIAVSTTDVVQFVESLSLNKGALKIKCVTKIVKNMTTGVTKNNNFIF